MNDFFATWVKSQEQMMAMHTEQLRAATRAMGMSEHFDGAIKAAQDIHSAQTKAWQNWLAMWGSTIK
jgi:hypothetical protein